MSKLTRILTGCLLVICYACQEDMENSVDHAWNTGAKAAWITDARKLPASDSLFYLDRPAPLFRKTFGAGGAIASAKLLITAAGYYQATINGASVGDHVLDPAWTDYSKRIYYSEYEVTDLLREGANCLGVSLGNGFYNPLPLRKWGQRNLRADLRAVGKPAFLTKLIIRYENGESEEIISDTTWTYANGPLIKNSVYLGVVYDARREMPGWDSADFDDGTWKPAILAEAPPGNLQKSFFPPVEITEALAPVDIYSPTSGVYMVDMGVNFTGTVRTKVFGKQGDTITFRFGERIYDDGSLNPMTSVIGQIKAAGVGGLGAPDTAWQTNTYIFGEDTTAWFQPPFVYHTFRYVEITGLGRKPRLSDIQGLFMHSNLEQPHAFASSNDLLNYIQEAVTRTFRANLVSVQSDCPAREKFGYGGDINATSESFIYNFDMQAFYRKTIYDWVDAMIDTGFVDTAPFVGIAYCGISWESAYLLTQYYLWLYYHDTKMVQELYEADKLWMEKVARLHPDGLVKSGLSDHESLEPVPVALMGTCHYLQCARVMTTFARVMGDQEAEEYYRELADRLSQLVRTRYWDQPVEGPINRQTLFATLLYHDIIPEDEIAAATDSLIRAVEQGPAGHFTTGIFGTKYVLEVLSKYGSPQLVFDIVNSIDYPGWGHMIDQGATTIWETWQESDNIYSNCHPMFGTVTEWYYRWLGGIRPDPAHPGFQHFVLAPFVPGGLEQVECTYQSPYGPIVSNWRQEGRSRLYELSVPPGTVARVALQKDVLEQISIRSNNVIMDAGEIPGLETGTFDLEEGDYQVTITAVEN